MPAPAAGQLEPIARGAITAAGLQGDDAKEHLAKALADVTAQALSLFLAQAMVMPGIPASAPQPAFSGSTVGPGTLMPPPAGGPTAAQLEPLALAALNSAGLQGKNVKNLAKVIAGALAQGLQLFTAQVKVAPGIPISGLVTTAPGRLM